MPSQTLGLSLAFGLVAYHFIEQLLQCLWRSLQPNFMERLRENRQVEPYFGFLMGLLITVTTGPVYILFAINFQGGVLRGWDDRLYALFAMRLTLFIAELSRLSKYRTVMVHHAMALSCTLFCLLFDLVPLPLTISFAGLISEAPGDLLYLFAVHGCNSSAWYYWLMLFNIVQYVFFRVTGSIISTCIFWAHDPVAVLPIWQIVFLNFFNVAYITYWAYYVYTQIMKLRSWKSAELTHEEADGGSATPKTELRI